MSLILFLNHTKPFPFSQHARPFHASVPSVLNEPGCPFRSHHSSFRSHLKYPVLSEAFSRVPWRNHSLFVSPQPFFIFLLPLLMKSPLATLSKFVIPLPTLPLPLLCLLNSPENLPLSPLLYIFHCFILFLIFLRTEMLVCPFIGIPSALRTYPGTWSCSVSLCRMEEFIFICCFLCDHN